MSKINTLFYVFVVGFLLSGCVSIPTGDGGKINLSKDGVEIEGEDGEKAKIEVDAKEGGATITTDDGNTIQMGSHAEMPEGFPASILVPAAEKLVNVTDNTDEEEEAFVLIYQLDDTMAGNLQKYKDYLAENDYEVNIVELSDTMVSLQAKKGKTSLMYQFVGEDGEYSLSLLYSVKKE